MPLSRKEFRRRVVAGAALHGLGMRALRDHLEEFGADRTLAEEMIRNETARGRRKNIRDLAEALYLPQAWFTNPEWWTLIPGAERPVETGPAALEEAAADLEEERGRREEEDGASGMTGEGG